MKLLRTFGANPKIENQNGEDPLYVASKLGFLEGVRYLAGIGLQIDKISPKSNCTPLGIAAFSGYLNVVKYLQNEKASLTKCGQDDNTPLLLACKGG